MNSKIEKDKESNNTQIPKVNKTQEIEDYQPVMPFDFKIETDFYLEQEQDDKMKLPLWKWHVRFNHVPFKKLKMLAEQGRIPRKLTKAELPFCLECTHSKATRRPWRGKETNKPLKKANYSGDCVSVDGLNQLQQDLLNISR